MTAIVYTSGTGFTERYARILSEKTGLEAYSLKDAIAGLQKGESVIYMGWLRAGRVQGFKKAARQFKIEAVVSVGMGIPNDMTVEETKKRCKTDTAFCLQGGLNAEKLKWPNSRLILNMKRSIVPALMRVPEQTPDTQNILMMLTAGGDFVSEENIMPVVEWVESARGGDRPESGDGD